ncbi:F193B protein, partial [Polypterus senegalus]
MKRPERRTALYRQAANNVGGVRMGNPTPPHSVIELQAMDVYMYPLPVAAAQSLQTCCLLCHRERKEWGSSPINGPSGAGLKLGDAFPQDFLGDIPGRKLADAVLGEVPLWICQSCRKSVEDEERRAAQEQALAGSRCGSARCRAVRQNNRIRAKRRESSFHCSLLKEAGTKLMVQAAERVLGPGPGRVPWLVPSPRNLPVKVRSHERSPRHQRP